MIISIKQIKLTALLFPVWLFPVWLFPVWCLSLALLSSNVSAKTTTETNLQAQVPNAFLTQATQQIARQEYYISPSSKGLQAPNRAHNLRAFFDVDGMRLQNRQAASKQSGSNLLQLQFNSLSRVSVDQQQPSMAQSLHYQQNRVTLVHHENLHEWYINNEKGIEHGFDLLKPIAGQGELILTIDVKQGQVIAPSTKSENLQIKLADNRLIDYKKLIVLDANQQQLPAQLLRLNAQQLQIRFDDSRAAYPLLIDPIITSVADAQLLVPAGVVNSNDNLGISVDSAGDVNNDGYGDVVVGASGFDGDQADEGAAFVFYGSATGISASNYTQLTVNLAASIEAGDKFGASVAGIGDVNGDGFDDIMVGATHYENGQVEEGAAYVFHGSAAGITTTYANIFQGNTTNTNFGTNVEGVGDINGDGFDDVLVAGPYYDYVAADGGVVWAYSGSATGLTGPVNDWKPTQADANFGINIAGAGDVNGDGFADILLGSYKNHGHSLLDNGWAGLYYGSATGYSTMAQSFFGVQNDSHLGHGLSSAGDVNNDGFADAVIAEISYDGSGTDNGRVYIYHGSASGYDTANPTTLDSQINGEQLGYNVADAGDVNNDGFDDIIIGTSGSANAYIYYGSSNGIITGITTTLTVNGATNSFGQVVAGAKDVNNDGYADVIVGESNHNGSATADGSAYVFHGSDVAGVTQASYDHSTGVLTVDGLFTALAGANNDISVSKLTITGENGDTYTLTGSDVERSNVNQFAVTLTGSDRAAINGLLNSNGTSSNTSATTYNLAVDDDFNAAVTDGDTSDATIALTVSNYTAPTITSATYDYASGTLVVTGDNFFALTGADNDITTNLLTITGSGNSSYTLTGANVEVDSASQFTITLSGVDKTTIDGLLNKNGTSADDNTSYNLAAADDFNSAATAGDTADATNPITVSNVAAPTVTSATYDATSGVLVVTATGLVNQSGANNDVDVSVISLTGEGGSYALANSSDVDIDSSSQFTITLDVNDKLVVDGLFNKNGTSADNGSVYNIALGDNWLTGAAASVDISDTTGNGVTVSNVTIPNISMATYDATTGIMVVTGSNLRAKIGANNDIDASLLTVTGRGNQTYTLTTTADVELDSNSQFTLTLDASDKLQVDGLLNKAGVSADDSSAYNLAVADNWLTGAATSTDISDTSGNFISVSNIITPTITSATYNYGTGTLTVTGNAMIATAGSNNDVAVNLLSLTGVGGNAYTLTGSNVELTSASSFSLTFSETDKLNINGLLNSAGTAGDDNTTYNLAAADNWLPSAQASIDISDSSNGVTVSNIVLPSISAISYDAATGVVTVTGANFVKKFGADNDIDLSLFTFTGIDGQTYTLTTNLDIDISSATSFSFTLTGTDFDSVNALIDANGTSSGGGTVYNIAVADNWMTGASGDISDSTITTTISNVPIPTISGVSFDFTAGTLSITGSGFVAKTGADNDVTTSAFTLTGQGSNTHTLTSSNVELTDNSSFTINLNESDRLVINHLLNTNGTNADDGTSYNLSASDDYIAQVTAGDTSSATNAINVQNVANPQISAASYNATTGSLILATSHLSQFSGASNDIDVKQLSFTGQNGDSFTLVDSTDVEVTSLTAATITIAQSDKLHLDGLLNLNGTSADDATAYQLSAADNWVRGAASNSDISDSGNSITVSAVTVPSITSASYDGTTGLLSVTASNLRHLTGSNNDIDVTKIAISGQGATSHTLTSSSVDITDSSSFSLTLNAADQQAIGVLLNKIGTSAVDGSVYNIAFSDNWLSAAATSEDIVDLTGNSINVTAVSSPTLTLSSSSTQLLEAGGSSQITASLSAATVNDVTVNLTLAGTATNSVDYTINSQLTIAAGQTFATTTVTSISDSVFEGAAGESIVIDIGTITGDAIAGISQTQTLTIIESGSAPTVALAVSQNSLLEATTSIQVTASLSIATTEDVNVTLSLTGTADNNDYSLTTNTMTISAGQTSVTQTLNIVGDTSVEADETIIIDISQVTGDSASELGEQQQTITIINDDSTNVSLTAATLVSSEQNGQFTFSLNLDKPSFEPVTVNLAYSGTATNGVDYQTPANSITIATGSQSTSFSINVIDDSSEEADETIVVTVTGVTGGAAQINGNQSLTATIENDDDETPPSGYQIAFAQSAINSANQNAIGLNISSAEVGSSYQYTIADNTTNIRASGTVTIANFALTNIDTSSLSDGQLTATLVLTDASNNAGINATATIEKDTQGPTLSWGEDVPAIVEGSFTLAMIFSESISGLTLDDLTLVNATASQLVGSGSSYSVQITPLLQGPLSVDLAAGTVFDTFNNSNLAPISYSREFIPPVVVAEAFSPANGATLVSGDTSLSITFDRVLLAGNSAGSNNLIEIFNQQDNSLVAAYPSDGSAVSINDKVVTITPTEPLPAGAFLYVNIGAGAFISEQGRYYDGISDNQTWGFGVVSLVPIAKSDNAELDEDTSVQIAILDNDRADTSPLNPASVVITTPATQGQTSLNTANGVITYTPSKDYAGPDSFNYTVADLNGGRSNEVQVSITVNNINDKPQAVADVANTDEDTLISIDVLANDSDADGTDDIDANSIQISQAPSNGQASLVDGKINYLPALDYFGVDSFSYQVADKAGALSDIVNVNITIGSLNDAPKTQSDEFTITEDTLTPIAVLDNDTDVDGSIDINSLAIVKLPTTGNVTLLNGTGIIEYTPGPDYNGTDSFEYSVSDESGATSAPTVVTITIEAVHDAPYVANDIVMVREDVNMIINPLGNDRAGDAPISALELVTLPQFGQVTLDSANMLLSYLPNQDYFGFDKLTYVLIDQTGARSEEATVELSVTPVNDPPLVNNDSYVIDEDQPQQFLVTANDQDHDGEIDLSSLTITTSALNGVAIANTDGTISYTPNRDFYGEDTFSYQLSDDLGATGQGTVSVTITPVNDAPTSADMGLSLQTNSTIAFTLTGQDVENDSFSYAILTDVQNGQLIGELTGQAPNLTYQPNTDYSGTDSFTYQLSDGQDQSAIYSVNIRVGLANQAPIASDMTLATEAQTPVLVMLQAMDDDGDNLSYQITPPQHGQLQGNAPVLVYTPNSDFAGVDSFTFSANDGELDSNLATVTLNVGSFNTLPVAIGQSLPLDEDSSISFNLTGSDANGDSLSYRIVSLPANGDIFGDFTGPVNASQAQLTYQPNSNFNGLDELLFVVNDGQGDSQTVAVEFSVNAINDQPTVNNQQITLSEDGLTSIALTGQDIDGDSLTYTVSQTPNNGSIEQIGSTLIYTPNDDYFGSDLIGFMANDGQIDSAMGLIHITITPVNDAPNANDDSVTITQWSVSDIDVLSNDSDIDGDSISLVGATTNSGEVSFSEQFLTYTPITGFNGEVVIDYTIADSQNRTSSAKAVVNVAVVDQSLPQITLPADINTQATGLLTQIHLGIATAVDTNGNPITPVLLAESNHFKPGAHRVMWQATDQAGNSAIASQALNLHPLVSLGQSQTVIEGQTVTLTVNLNGPSPIYPLIVGYSVSGSSVSGADHTLSDGSIEIASGLQGQIQFEILTDSEIESDESLTVTLNDTLNRGAVFSQTFTISEQDIAPKIVLTASQAGDARNIVNQQEGLITVKAQVSHPDANKQFNYVWQSIGSDLINQSNEENLFIFDPSVLSEGLYHINLSVISGDNLSEHESSTTTGQKSSTATGQITLTLQASPTVLTDADSDNDGIPDSQEGLEDKDNDGIPDYLDNIDQCNVLVSDVTQTTNHLLESEPGVCIRLGNQALIGATQGQSGGALVSSSENSDNSDPQATNIGGLFDFKLFNLPKAGQHVDVVLPQQQPIPPNAVYRKQQNDGSWQNFVVNDSDTLWSAQGSKGICPPPAYSTWQQGLIEGSWCVQLRLTDGGPNDNDATANGTIVDPGGIGVILGDNNLPIAVDDNTQVRINTQTNIDILANDSDPDGDELTLAQAQANYGQVTIVTNQISYQPQADFTGTDIINYTIYDQHQGAASATVTVTVLANQAPIATNDYIDAVAGKAIVIDVLSNDTDPENDSLTLIAASADNGAVSVNTNNQLSYTANQNYSGLDTINYQIQDSYGAIAYGQVTVTVTQLTPAQPSTTKDTSDKGGAMWGLLLMAVLLGFRRRGSVDL